MKNVGAPCSWGFGVFIGSLILSGCAGTGEVVTLDIRAIPSAGMALKSGKEFRKLKVLVQAFQDQRPSRERLGVRTHLGGGVTIFDLENGNAGETAARVLADYLRQQGWTVGLGTPEMSGLRSRPDVIFSGRVLELTADAKSRFWSTLLRTSIRLVLLGTNTVDNSSARMTLEDEREETVFWFDPDDMEELINQMMKESVEKLLDDLHVVQGALRLN